MQDDLAIRGFKFVRRRAFDWVAEVGRIAMLVGDTFRYSGRGLRSFGLIVQQALALGGIGWTMGLVLLLAIKDHFPRRVALDPENALVLGGIIFVVCIVASGLGVRAALRVDPATALGG